MAATCTQESQIFETLTRLYESGRLFQFVQLAHEALRAMPHCPELATLNLEALIELELGGPARELVQLRRDATEHSQNPEAVLQRIAGLPNGRVPWSQRREVCARNIDALSRNKRFGLGATTLKECLAGIQLFRTSRGDYQASRRREAGTLRQWLPPITGDLDAPEIDLPPRSKLGVPVIVGVSHSATCWRLIEETKNLYLTYSHPVHLIEPDVARFAAWLHVADLTELLADERVYVFVGPNGVSELRKLLAEDTCLAIPTLHVGQGVAEGDTLAVRQAAEKAVADRERQLQQLVSQIERRDRDRDLAYWKRRFEKPGTVLGITSRFTTMLQYSLRDAMDALQRQDFQTQTLIEPDDHHQFSPIALCQAILQHDPDFVISLDHLRYEHTYLPKTVPFLTWIQDPMDNLLCGQAGASIGPVDFVCGFYRDRCIQEFGYPADRFVYTDIPVSTRVFHAAPLNAIDVAQYGCDVSFVSNASAPIDAWFRSSRAGYPAVLHPLLDYLYEQRPSLETCGGERQPSVVAIDVVRDASRRFGLSLTDAQVRTIAIHFLYRLFDWGRRQESLEWVGGWAKRTGRRFKLYGRGWEDHPTLSAFAAGPVEHGEPLQKAYRASTLGLQLIPSGFRHQRTYELVACGTLPITRHCDVDFAGTFPTSEQFPPLRDIVFRDAAEFERLAEALLGDEDKRRELHAGLHERVMQRYTYDAVMSTVLEGWKTYFARVAD